MFEIFQTLAFCVVCLPVFYNQWIFTGAGNANFYYGLTITSNFVLTWLLTDMLHAVVLREYDEYFVTQA